MRPKVPPPPATPTTVGEQLAWATAALDALGSASPTLDAAVLLGAAICVPIDGLAASLGALMTSAQVDRLLSWVAERARIESVAGTTIDQLGDASA